MIYNLELEKRVLSGMLQIPDAWGEVAAYLNEKDFFSLDSKINVTLFKLLRNALNKSESIDDTILIQRLNSLGCSFQDGIDVNEYIHSLAYFKITKHIFIASVKELKKFTAKREIYNAAKSMAEYAKKISVEEDYESIVGKADEIYNETIQQFELVDNEPKMIFKDAEFLIESIANNPPQELGMMSGHKRLDSMYGSLVLPGNICCIVARSAAGKSTFAMDYVTRLMSRYDIPVLHFDNGEMSAEEITFRQMSVLTGFPISMFQYGIWRKSTYNNLSVEQVKQKVKECWPILKKMKFYYYNVAGMSPDEMNSLLKHFYYSKIGRGNPMTFSYDYIKSDFTSAGSKMGDWFNVARSIDKFKQTIHRDLCFDGKPQIGMFCSIQANRSAVVGSRSRDSIVEDESVVSLSDAVTQFSSHLFLLRKKTNDEIFEQKGMWGTHILRNLKPRHLGIDNERALNLVDDVEGNKVQNYINFSIKNFKIEEKGDFQDYIDHISGRNDLIGESKSEEDDDLPDVFK